MPGSILSQMAHSMYFFWIALFGAAMLSIAVILGHGDHEVDHDTDHDHGDGHGENMSFFSIKIFWMFLVGFGAGGYFSANAGSSMLVASLFGLLGGLVFGALGYIVMNYLYKHQGSSTVKTSGVVGSTAIVDTAITVGRIGEVRCTVDGRTEYFQAQSRIDTLIPVGSRVKVIDSTGSLLVVEPES